MNMNSNSHSNSNVEYTTKNLNRVLGRKELFGIASGQIIDAGIMSMTGIAIGMTGRSVKNTGTDYMFYNYALNILYTEIQDAVKHFTCPCVLFVFSYFKKDCLFSISSNYKLTS